MNKFPVFLFVVATSILLNGCSCHNNHEHSHQDEISEEPNASLYGYNIEERFQYEFNRLKDPVTGEVPHNMRAKELAFGESLPKKWGSGRSLGWTHLGPNNLGGRTRALALDVNDENIILAGGVTGGMWRSTNGGASFTKTTTPEQIHSVTSIAQDTRSGHTNTWYYGTGEYYAIVSAASFSSRYSGNGIFKSTDGGQSWALLESTKSNTPTTLYENGDFDFVWEIVTDHTDMSNDVVLAAVYNGIYRSDDGGISWTAVHGLDTSVGATSDYVDLAKTNTGVFYAALSSDGPAGTKGIWRSNDGINWVEITPSGWPSNYNRIEMGIAPSDENQVYFIANTPGTGVNAHQLWHYTYLSGDGTGAGGTWDNRTANIPNEDCTGFYTFNFGPYKSQSGYDMCISVKPDDPDVVFLGGTNIYRSTDGFTTYDYDWIGGYYCDTATPSNYLYPGHHPDNHKMLFLPSDNNVIISAHDGGLSKTQNCLASTVSWTSLNNGYSTGQFYTVAQEPGETSSNIAVGGLQDNGTWFGNSSGAADWEMVFYGDGAYAAITEGRENYYLSWQTGKTFKFEIDDAGNVQDLTRIDPFGASGHLFINPFILDPTDDDKMYLSAGRYIWRNDSLNAIPIIGDEYNSISDYWSRINGSNTGTGFPSPSISTLDMSAGNNNVLYYGTSSGDVFKLVKPRDNGATKQSISQAGWPNGYVSCVDISDKDTNNIMMSFSNYGVKSIWVTTDGGASWSDVSGNLEENTDGSGDGPAVFWVHQYEDNDTTIYFAGTSIGLFSTTVLNDTMTVWAQEGPGSIGNVVINMISSRPYDGRILIATHGNGIYQYWFRPPVGVEEPALVSESNSLGLPYPSPAVGQIKVPLNIAESGYYRLNLYNLKGQRVGSILHEKLQPGEYKLKYNVGELPAGQYVLELSNGKESHSRTIAVQ